MYRYFGACVCERERKQNFKCFTAIWELWDYINGKRKYSNPRCVHLYRLLVRWGWGQVKTLEWKAENHIYDRWSIPKSPWNKYKIDVGSSTVTGVKRLCFCETTKDAIDILIENIMSGGTACN